MIITEDPDPARNNLGEPRHLGAGLWAVGCGLWAVGCGLWAVGCGLWAVGRGATRQRGRVADKPAIVTAQ